jgi:hypothetical protein
VIFSTRAVADFTRAAILSARAKKAFDPADDLTLRGKRRDRDWNSWHQGSVEIRLIRSLKPGADVGEHLM